MPNEIIYKCRYNSEAGSGKRRHRFMFHRKGRSELRAECEEIIRKFDEESEYIPIPERLDKVDDLISSAKDIALFYELNMDIVQRVDGINFDFYYDSGLFLGECREYFGRMFLTCDSVTVYKPRKKRDLPKGCEGIISMTYYTHRHLVAGKEINIS